VFELTWSVAIGFALLHSIEAIVAGLILQPIRTPAYENSFGGSDTGFVTIGGRLFDWLHPLAAVFVLAALLVILGRILAGGPGDVDEPETECPHCLSAIPEGASVCCYCTRDVA
jgi:hypothetical protein